MHWTKEKIQTCIDILSKYEFIKDALEEISSTMGEDITSPQIRGAFSRHGFSSPSQFLDGGLDEDFKDIEQDGLKELDKMHLPDEGKYVINMRHRDGLVCIDEKIHKQIKKKYSDVYGISSGEQISAICSKYGWTKEDFLEYKRIFGMTHSSSPFTQEELVDAHGDEEKQKQLEKQIAKLVDKKVRQRARQKQLREHKKKAKKWDEFHTKHIDPFKKWIVNNGPSKTIESKDTKTNPYLLVPDPTDVHLGKLGVDEGYDLKDAIFESTDRIISQVKKRGLPEKIVLPVGSDWFHFNNSGAGGTGAPTTDRGTPQDPSGIPEKVIIQAADLAIDMIDMWRQLGDIKLVLKRGNHDGDLSILLLWGLQKAYRNCDDVDVDVSWNYRTYYEYYDNMIMFHHGDNLKTKQVNPIMSNEMSDMWGRTKHRYAISGHWHTLKEEDKGVVLLTSPALSPTCRWGDKNGYMLSSKSQIAYLFDRHNGLFAKEIATIVKGG